MDLSLLQKVNELAQEGRSAAEIKLELQTSGIAPETIDEALKEAGPKQEQNAQPAAPAAPLTPHREKIIMPTPGFDPNDKS
jgi:hypothetical protein